MSNISNEVRKLGDEEFINSIKRYFQKHDIIFILLLITVSSYVFFYKLGSFPLSSWDEGVYGNLARHMVEDGYWITPHMHFLIGLEGSSGSLEPWYSLPPLGIWLQAISMLIFGINEFAVRFPSATAGVITGIIIYFIGRDLFNRIVGETASIIFVTTPYMYGGFNAGREGGLDSLLVLFGTLTIYSVWKSRDWGDPRLLIPSAILGSITFLVKGFGAVAFVIPVLPTIIHIINNYRVTWVARSVLALIFISLPWPIVMIITHGWDFVNEFVLIYAIKRASGEAFIHEFNPLFDFMKFPYLKSIILIESIYHPWVFLLVTTIPTFCYLELASNKLRRVETGFILWWFVGIFLFYLVLGSKIWYIMPIFVPGSIIIGIAVDELWKGSVHLFIALIVGMILFIGISPISTGYRGTVIVGIFVMILVGSQLHQFRTQKSNLNYPNVGIVLKSFFAIILILSLVGTPPVSTSIDTRIQFRLATVVNDEVPPDEPVFIGNMMEQPFHTYSFYSDRSLISGPINSLDQYPNVEYVIINGDSELSLHSNYTVVHAVNSSKSEFSLIKLRTE